jgi:hypothetical protein
MELLTTILPGKEALVDSTGAQVANNYAIRVYFDPTGPKRERLNVSTESSLLFKLASKLAGVDSTALLDSGASTNYVGAEFCKNNGIRISPPVTAVEVEVANGKVIRTLGTCTAPLRVQQYSGTITAHVLPVMTPNVDIILGQSWLLETGAVMDYPARKCKLEKTRNRVVLNGNV